MPAVVVENLVKDYGTLRAVDGLSFTVEQGEVVALLGPNGAGKSTAVEILEGHRTRTSGQVTVLGADPATGGAAFRDRIGIVLQECGIERELTITEALNHYGACYTRTRPLDEVLELTGLTDLADRRTHQLSGGQKRRIDLALGLIGDPELLFLDEPTTGFDPSARRQAWDMVRGLRTLGTTILLTSHYMDEVEALADRVLVINQGKLVAQGTPDELRAGIADTTLVRFDPVYHGHFKCNIRRLIDYPNLYGYTLDLYQQPGVADTVDFDHIKRHYYITHDDLNPTQVVPLGPDMDLTAPHGRDAIG